MLTFTLAIFETILCAVSSLLWVWLFFAIMGEFGPNYPAWLPWLTWVVSFECDLIKFNVKSLLKKA